MIKCSNIGCEYGYCCIECETRSIDGISGCFCDIARELKNDSETILGKCKYASEAE